MRIIFIALMLILTAGCAQTQPKQGPIYSSGPEEIQSSCPKGYKQMCSRRGRTSDSSCKCITNREYDDFRDWLDNDSFGDWD